MFSAEQLKNASHLLDQCRAGNVMLAAAESCTGGLIAGLITEIAGSSDVFDRGFITYSNAAKCELLGVDAALIADHGAVSESVVRAMAEGALQHSTASLSIAVTGIAGPTGGSPDKPVGLVYLATAMPHAHTKVEWCEFGGDRHAIRMAAVNHAVTMLLARVAD